MAHPPQEPVAQRTADDPRPVQTADGAKVLASFMLRTNGGGSLEEVAGFGNRRAIVDRFETVRLPVPPGYGYDTPAPWAGPSLQPAWLGSVPFATGSILPVELRPPMPGAGLENVIGPDDRVMVPDTATIPWRCICHLEVIFDNGVKAYGTGWLVGPDTVITAAHCVWDPRTGEQAAEIRIAPGRNGSMGPYGQFVTADYAVMQGWPDAGNFGLDVAAIRLPRDAGMFAEGVGARLGYFGLAAFEDAKLEMLLVNTSGYPLEAAKPFATQWFNGGRIKAAETDYVTYMIDTEGGQSGSPIFFYEKETEERLVVAIHTVGYYPNRGVRITPKLLEVIHGWIAKPPTGRPAKPARGRRRS